MQKCTMHCGSNKNYELCTSNNSKNAVIMYNVVKTRNFSSPRTQVLVVLECEWLKNVFEASIQGNFYKKKKR